MQAEWDLDLNIFGGNSAAVGTNDTRPPALRLLPCTETSLAGSHVHRQAVFAHALNKLSPCLFFFGEILRRGNPASEGFSRRTRCGEAARSGQPVALDFPSSKQTLRRPTSSTFGGDKEAGES